MQPRSRPQQWPSTSREARPTPAFVPGSRAGPWQTRRPTRTAWAGCRASRGEAGRGMAPPHPTPDHVWHVLAPAQRAASRDPEPQRAPVFGCQNAGAQVVTGLSATPGCGCTQPDQASDSAASRPLAERVSYRRGVVRSGASPPTAHRATVQASVRITICQGPTSYRHEARRWTLP